MSIPARSQWLPRLGLAGLVAVMLLGPLRALTLNELQSDPKLTPKKFADQFEDFTYEFIGYVQDPEIFLRTRNGDCDDYAILAAHVLAKKDFTPRLLHVRMVGRVAHAVCYIVENRAYLDYNNRRYTFNLQRCGPSIREIASKVARSLESNWTSATEFTYDYKTEVKNALFTVVKTEPPGNDPDRGRY
jgi:hypothetical protein